MDQQRPLIVSALNHDIHAAAVCWGLQAHGLRPLWARSWADPALPALSMSCGAGPGLRMQFGDGAGFSSVWFRRPRLPAQFPGALEADQEFLGNEWRRFAGNLHALGATTPGAFWVNPPAAALEAENKLVQLHAAHEAGLPFPDTLMSADPDAIRRFAAAHGRVVYKPFQTHSWQDGATGQLFSTYARVVDDTMLADDASLRLCPGIFQQMVDKQYDVRVTVIGSRVFAARLDAAHQGDFLDWRVGSLADRMQVQPYALPASWEDALQRLMQRLGIVLGCVDLAADRDGNLHFLEVNQAGQFLFVEQQAPSLPLLRAMCALLAQARVDYVLEDAPNIDYATFLDSAQYLAWWSEASRELGRQRGAVPAGVSLE